MKAAVRVKICGMTRQEDITHAIMLGVDAIGLVFYEKSKRYVSCETAKKLLPGPFLFVDVVAVLVNPTLSFVSHIIDNLPIRLLQFHGDETPEFCRQFPLPYIKAIPATDPSTLTKAMSDYHDAVGILLDSPFERGGSGKVFDWHRIPGERTKPLLLAGGLTVDNVGSAIRICSPSAVDVCSGVESEPGIKDHQKMTAFVKACGDQSR
jgi:phosphoribosylanthranilate isomerase